MRKPARCFEDLGYSDDSKLGTLLEEISKMLEAYSRSICESKS
jgi:hypothetical protein